MNDFIEEYIMDEVGNTGREAQYDDDEKYADYDPYANFYDYDTDEEDEDDDEEENDGDGTENDFSGEDDYGGAGDYGVVGDDEEDTEGNEDEEGSENPDAQADNEGEGNASPDGKQSDKESLAKTYKDKRLTFSDIVFLWSKLEKNPTTKSMLVPINSAVREGLGAGTAGFSYLITLIKPKYPVKPVQALLELSDSPMGNILMSPKALIETVFNLPPVKKLVIQALEILDKAEKPSATKTA